MVIHGILFYKALIAQAQHMHGLVEGMALTMDQRVHESVIAALGPVGPPATAPASPLCVEFVAMCLTKIGDLMRCAASVPVAIIVWIVYR